MFPADIGFAAHENGQSELLVQLLGTLPVIFRGSTYNIPISIWVPHQYPSQPPIAFITPAKDMMIRPGNHVDLAGRCYHPYLANWIHYSDVRAPRPWASNDWTGLIMAEVEHRGLV